MDTVARCIRNNRFSFRTCPVGERRASAGHWAFSYAALPMALSGSRSSVAFRFADAPWS